MWLKNGSLLLSSERQLLKNHKANRASGVYEYTV
jgi:hypothetical protein